MSDSIYVYDIRSTMDQPLFVVFDYEHVNKFATALFGSVPDYLYVTKERLHVYAAPPYKFKSSSKQTQRKKR